MCFLFLLKFRLDFDDIYSIMISTRPAPQPDGPDYQTRQAATRKAVAPQQDLVFLVSANVVDLAFVA